VRFGLGLPIVQQVPMRAQAWEANAGGPELVRIAQAADRLGFAHLSASDHVLVPRSRADAMGAPWYDAAVTLAFLAGVTQRIRLLSHVVVLPYRHPLLVAKAFGTLDHLSRGRVILGVGSGHLKPEFRILGAPYERRGSISDEYLQAIAAAWEKEVAEFRGETVSFRDVLVAPRPVQRPRPPIWVGGAAPAAVRRAGRLADGWLPQGTPLDQMPPLVDLYRKERADATGDGSTGDIGAISEWIYVGEPAWDVNRPCVSGSPEQIADSLTAWAKIGVNHLQVRFPSRSVDELADQVAAFGAQVGPLLPH
jgi:probable F420-dependent oxidoreductase